ncbi:tRNA pseudouridine(55) synthase [Anncaliia algerae PRA339]|uniref:H/ACA ribonucleoprotein complex subunit CBF5 n=1 Tax=Anncaliia algerae PRA339 TaxID=1288291 RepID=A0A059F3T4_9MICR|nr:tRNA pseudouridine(55) synthase [Anncaliia algerae PRA339]
MINPLLEKDDFLIKTTDYVPLSCGYTPYNRPIDEYLKYAVIAIDKPKNPSSHEVVTWIKNITNAEKTGHGGTLDPQVSGALVVCLNKATRLTKSMQNEGKEYVCTIEFENKVDIDKFKEGINKLTGVVFQRPPLMCAVKRQLRIREIYSIEILDYNEKEVLFRVKCEAGTYIRTLCTHFGLYLGNKAIMKDLRRTSSGHISEDDCFTMHDLLDSFYLLKQKDEALVRRVLQPLEVLLTCYKRIMVKDSAIGAICAGAQLTINGIIKYDSNIEINDEIVLISSKGEAIALAVAKIASPEIKILEKGIVCKTKRVIMDKTLYPCVWGNKKKFDIYP